MLDIEKSFNNDQVEISDHQLSITKFVNSF